ncbi:hypothetical protein ACSNOI_30805 [Actinomadura kijaniata]|uniref:hypothetical protein n=1 Tax=Actinomadura kijaniata TaxID=46161 RepID=UPI003F1A74AA
MKLSINRADDQPSHVGDRHRKTRPCNFDYHHVIHYCVKGGKVATIRDLGTSRYFSTFQDRIDNCMLKYGCIKTFYPWSDYRISGNGHYAWSWRK